MAEVVERLTQPCAKRGARERCVRLFRRAGLLLMDIMLLMRDAFRALRALLEWLMMIYHNSRHTARTAVLMLIYMRLRVCLHVRCADLIMCEHVSWACCEFAT